MTNLNSLPKIKLPYKHTVEPTWANDAGRYTNSGKFTGTFVGYFDTLEISVGKTNQSELTEIRSHIEVPIIEDITFLDTKTGNLKTADFYGTAISVEPISYKSKIYKPFAFSLKAIERRKDM